jgi:hypothetical protein
MPGVGPGIHVLLTFAAREAAAPQISIATEGGSGTPVPDLSIEVNNLDEVHQRVLAGSPLKSPTLSTPSDPQPTWNRIGGLLGHRLS